LESCSSGSAFVLTHRIRHILSPTQGSVLRVYSVKHVSSIETRVSDIDLGHPVDGQASSVELMTARLGIKVVTVPGLRMCLSGTYRAARP